MDWFEFKKQPVEVKDFKKLTNHFGGILRIYSRDAYSRSIGYRNFNKVGIEFPMRLRLYFDQAGTNSAITYVLVLSAR